MQRSRPFELPDDGWLMPPRSGEPADLRLLCWPYAGLGPSLFVPWAQSAPPGMAVYGVQAPGRQRRLGETPISSLPAMLDRLIQELEAQAGFLDGTPYALVGCSFGAVAAFELARRLTARGHPPVSVTAIACRPPHAVHPLPPFSTLDDRALIDLLDRDYGGIPAALREQPDVLELLVPALRGDLTALERYVPPPAPARLPCPVHAIGGDADRTVPPALLREWLRYGAGSGEAALLPGHHFVVRDAPRAVFDTVLGFLGDRAVRAI